MKSSKGISLVEVLIWLAVIAIILALLYPGTGGSGISAARKAQAKNDVVQITTAINAFQTEYNHMPPTNSDGLFSGELLTALVGENKAANPRDIVFIEIGTAKKNSKSGLRDGVFVDPWGGPYQVAIATGTNNRVLAGTNHIEVLKKVAAWNDPGKQSDAYWTSDAKKNRRYVTSWD